MRRRSDSEREGRARGLASIALAAGAISSTVLVVVGIILVASADSWKCGDGPAPSRPLFVTGWVAGVGVGLLALILVAYVNALLPWNATDGGRRWVVPRLWAAALLPLLSFVWCVVAIGVLLSGC
jgi:hypothetical protein